MAESLVAKLPEEWNFLAYGLVRLLALKAGYFLFSKSVTLLTGVDINGRDENERTVIMTMIIEGLVTKSSSGSQDSKVLNQQLLDEVCDMIDRRNADPGVQDKFSRNILHYLAGWDCTQICDKDAKQKKAEMEQRHKILLKYIEKFLEYGCDAWACDQDGDWPLAKALRTKISLGRNYAVIDLLLNHMGETVPKHLDFPPDKNTVLEAFASNLSLAYIEKEKQIFEKLLQLLQSFGPNLKDFVSAKAGPNSSFLTLCSTYANFPKITEEPKDEQVPFLPSLSFDQATKLIIGYEEKWKVAREILVLFVENLKPIMVYYSEKVGEKKVVTKSAALAILGFESSNEPAEDGLRPGFQYILKHCKEVDCKDVNDRSQLEKAVSRGHLMQSRNLLAAGANANQVFEDSELKSCLFKGQLLTYKEKSYPLLEAIKSGNHELVKLLLSHGAILIPDTSETLLPNGKTVVPDPFLLAIKLSKESRSNRSRLDIVKDIINTGADVASVDEDGMSALHVAVFGSSGRADEALDLEMALIKHDADVFAECSGRYPLHDIFREASNDTTKDPIEVCSMLVEAMKGKNIDKPDDLGRSPLHYAANCGATISCLLLLNKGDNHWII